MTSTVLFESWRGAYADSPACISEVLGRRRPELQRFWAVNPGTRLPGGVSGLRRHSTAHLARFASTDVLISNDVVARRYLPRRGTTYVQTWHGTPVKLLGFDERVRAYDPDGSYLRALRRDVQRWDFLVSPSPVATELLRSAFRYDGEVLEVGYPRNDVLLRDHDDAVRRRVRAALGASDSRVVLYAPTWRDDGRPVWEDRELEALVRGLPEGVEMWARRHHNDTALPPHPAVRDVSDWPDVAELYLGADVLLSDYSSATVDFAVTRKPIVHFVPDLERFTALRGLYVDYESWAPGPVTRTGADAVEAIKLLAVDEERYDRFVRTFCPYEDGGAGERLVEALAEVFPAR